MSSDFRDILVSFLLELFLHYLTVEMYNTLCAILWHFILALLLQIVQGRKLNWKFFLIKID